MLARMAACCKGQLGVTCMHTLIAHSALWRGMSLFAGMLWVPVAKEVGDPDTATDAHELVSWCAGARSRREDELARSAHTSLQSVGRLAD